MQSNVGMSSQNCVDRFCGQAFCSYDDFPPNGKSKCAVFSKKIILMAKTTNFSISLILGFSRPFIVRVHFDQDEMEDGPPYLNRGFCLNYVQQPCAS